MKPRPNKSISQQLACLCTKMNCFDKIDGSGCFKCEIACENAIQQNSNIRPFFYINLNANAEYAHANVMLFTFVTRERNLHVNAKLTERKKWILCAKQNWKYSQALLNRYPN